MAAQINISVYDYQSKVNYGPVANLMDGIELQGAKTWALNHKVSLPEVVDSRIAVVHLPAYDDNSWRSVCKPHADGTQGPTVRLRVSTVGKQNVGPKSCEPYVTKEKVVCLSLHQRFDKQENAPSAQDWQKILSLLCRENLPEIISGDPANWPDTLRKYFCCPSATTLLVALAILCQGYLAMHASADGKPEGVKNGEYGTVAEALESMGWTTLCQSGEGRELLFEVLRTDDDASKSSRAVLRRKVTQVDSELWKPMADEKELANRFISEWQSINSDEIPEDVKWLIDRIAEKKRIDQPGKVAQAYLYLANALEAW